MQTIQATQNVTNIFLNHSLSSQDVWWKMYTHEEMQVRDYFYSQICLRNASQRKYLPFISNHASLTNIHKQNIRNKQI